LLQLPVTYLDLLGLDYTQLQGAAAEGTKPLPGLKSSESCCPPKQHG
jgi:hypothetical protein